MRRNLFLLTVFLCLNVSLGMVQADTGAGSQKASKASKSTINHVGGIHVEKRDGGTVIRLTGNQDPNYSVFKLHSPLRLFVDISNSQLNKDVPRAPIKVDNGIISQVAVLDFSDNVQKITRVIVGFDTKASYDVRTDGNDIVIFIEGQGKGADPVASRELKQREKQLEQARKALREKERRLMEIEHKVASLEKVISSKDGADSAQTVLRDSLKIERDKAGKLRADLAQRESKLRLLQESLQHVESKAKNRISDLEQKLRDEQSHARELRTNLANLKGQRSQAQSRAKDLQKERDAAQKHAKSLEKERDKARESARQLAQKLEKSQAGIAAIEKDLKRAQTELASAQKARENALNTTSTLRSEIAALRKDLDSKELQASKLKRSIAANKAQDGDKEKVSGLETEIKTLSSTLDTKSKALDKAIAQARSLESAKDKAQANTDRVAEQRRAQLAKLQSVEEARLSALEDSRKKEQERLGALETARKAEENRLEQLAQARKAEEQELKKAKEARIVQEKARKTEEEKLKVTRQERQKEEAKLAKMRSTGRVDGSTVDTGDVNAINVIRSVRYQQKAEVSRIIVDLTEHADFKTVPWKNGKAELVFSGVQLPKNLERSLDTRAFGGAVQFVNSFQDDKGRVHIEAEIPGASMELVHQDGSTLIWEFTRAGRDPIAQTNKPAGPKGPSNLPSPSGFTAQPPVYTPPSSPSSERNVPPWWRRPKGMSMKRLDIDLRAADIENVLRLLAKEGGVNIVYGGRPGSGGNRSNRVTMRLNNVPIADAFVGIVKSLKLGYDQTNGVIRVADVVEFEAEAKKQRENILNSFPLEPLEVVLLPVNYAAAEDLGSLVQSVLSTRGSANVDRRTNTLIIKDVAANLAAAQQLVLSLDTQTPQVLIESRIVETNDRYIRELGIQWGGDFLFSPANGNSTGLIFPSSIGVSGAANDGQAPVGGVAGNPNFAVNLPAPIGTGAGGGIGLTLGQFGSQNSIALRLSALEEDGHIKIVSAPKILTLDNRPATISQGTSIPFSVVSANGVQTVFIEARLQLDVEPHITQDGNILLKLRVDKSEPDFENTGSRGDPTIIRKQAETELLIADGDTTVIGGIYSKSSGSSMSKVPWLGDIPVLGYFFRNYSENESRTELLIFVTPRIVNREAALAARRLAPIRSPQAAAAAAGN